MTESDTDSEESTNRGPARRTLLKAAAIASAAGSGLAGFSGPGRGQEDELENTITIEATGDVAAYRFTVSGDVELGSDAGAGEDVIRGNTVTGKVGGFGTDSFRYSGRITSFEFTEGSAKVFVNGREVETLPPTELPNVLTVRAVGETASYEFSVSGDVELGPEAGAGADAIEGNTARGRVGGFGSDSFRFSGDITDLSREDGPVQIVIDFDEADHQEP